VNGDQPSPRAVQLRLLAALVALAAGMTALVIAILLVRSVLG
jgi:heme exporter protein D